MNRRMSIRFAFLSLACACLTYAQVDESATFIEAAPPPGVVKGFIKAGGRYGALIAGGKTVHSNDLFTVTTEGHTVTWKVLDISDKTARFAREQTDSVNPVPPQIKGASNFGDFLMLFEQGAQSYKAASTRALKDQVMEETRKRANDWCASNRILRVKGTLSDLTASDDNTARLRVKNVDCGPFSAIRCPNLYVHRPFQFSVIMTKEQALSFKAGDAVVLTGTPTFHPGTGAIIANGLIFKPTVTCFMILGGIQTIGALTMSDIRYDIFDPKSETVQRR